METMGKTPDLPKKCFCARCFLPIDGDERVDIEGQNFHRICSMCCICRNVPKSLKTFYGHVFCTECFKTHVLSRFRGERKVQSNSWWTPGAEKKTKKASEDHRAEAEPVIADEALQESADVKEDPAKKQICARCLQMIQQDQQVTLGGQVFHQPCARCYCCHIVPADSLKIYYGQVFCEECFNRFVINRDKDNPSEFYKSCFDSWNNSPQFAETMREFMSSGKSTSPIVFMMQQGQQAPFCRCGAETQQPAEPNKCKTAAVGDTHCVQRTAQLLARGDSHQPPLQMKGLLIETAIRRQNGPLRHCSAPSRPDKTTTRLNKGFQLDNNTYRYLDSLRYDNRTNGGDEKPHQETKFSPNDGVAKHDHSKNSVLFDSNSVLNDNESLLDDSRSFQLDNVSLLDGEESLQQDFGIFQSVCAKRLQNGSPQPRTGLQEYEIRPLQANKDTRLQGEGSSQQLGHETLPPASDPCEATFSQLQNKTLRSGTVSPWSKSLYLQNEAIQKLRTSNLSMQNSTGLHELPNIGTPAKSTPRYNSGTLPLPKSPTRFNSGLLQSPKRPKKYENGTPKLAKSSIRQDTGSKLRNMGTVQSESGSAIPHTRTARQAPKSPNPSQCSLLRGHESPKRKTSLHKNESTQHKISTQLSQNGPVIQSTFKLHDNDSLRYERVSLHDRVYREDGSFHLETRSMRSDTGSIQHDDTQHEVESESSSLIPLFQNSLEPERVLPPRRRFLRNHEKKLFAATSSPAGDDADGWDLLSIHADTETYEDYSSIGNELANLDEIPDVGDQEKIEKLTQYLHHVTRKNRNKNWKMFYNNKVPESKRDCPVFSGDKTVCDRGEGPEWRNEESVLTGWVNIQLGNKKIDPNCPKCIWQSDILTANGGFVSKLLSSGSVLSE